VELIRHHHDPHAQRESLLAALQAADDKN